ncbi:MAG: DUF1553 domain-containing protein [Planctomycetes bacterium]|nr:DUF1553 domain-containing protein [Planctomycetota bacterium]
MDFGRHIQPLLAKNCIRCHGPRKQEGGLRLDVRQRAMRGGDSGPAIVKGNAGASQLLRRIAADGDQRMPPSGPPLTQAQKTLLRHWIEQQAPWPDELAGNEELDRHWAFRPVRVPPLPRFPDQSRVRNVIDVFVLARLQAKGLTYSPEAGRTTLVRRLHLDLIGLSPAPEEVQAFLDDPRPDAYERQVERLLASPHFGERWGRHWLDLARFAESDGYENDNLRPDAWRFRDWVVQSINRDQPFDQFTVEQLAGDLLPEATVDQKVAAGFHRHTLWNSAASADKEEFRTLAIKDRADTTAAAWMGLTLGCAKCHSHKYDPISQREYYQLYAFFNNTDNRDVAIPGGRLMTLAAVQRATHVHKRGNFLSKGDEVKPGVPAFLPALPAPTGQKKSADRLDLARWLTDPRHPLTARVAVNRFWQHLFGQGLVTTPDNFGVNGLPPSHPELLDWLAAEFVRLNWSRKALIRTIVTSSAYRQSSALRDDLTKADPGNALLGRQNRFRLEAEIIRDLALAAGGLLDRRLGGVSIVPPYPEGFLAQRFTNEALKMPTRQHHRRSIYIHVQRTLTHPLLAVFDAADGNQPCLRRDRSTTPMQALTLLNDPVFVECAQALGGRLRVAAGNRDKRLRWAFQLCTGRPANDREMLILRELVDVLRDSGGEEMIWSGVARVLLNLEHGIMRE